ncbi:MAG: zinc-ribbon domain-containing protein [Firmicutes bacterium]|nr:zinc-ribbon domain-containing protein [Bacillota bacterium]
MKCPNCGAELSEEMRFCGNCGAKISAAPDNSSGPAENNVKTNNVTKSRQNSGVKVAIGAIAATVVAVGAGVGGFSAYQSSLVERADNAVSNGDYELAMDLYEKVSSLSADKSKAETMVSKLTGAKAAARDAGKALENGDEAEMRKNISKAYSLIPDYKPAAEVEKTIELQAELNEAETCVNSGEYAKVLALAKEIEAMDLSSEYYAICRTQMDDMVKIVNDFESASVSNANAALQSGNTALAENITAELLRRLPDSEQGKALNTNIENIKGAAALVQSAQAKKNSGDYAGALADLDSAFAKYPAYKSPYTQLYNDIQNLKTQADAAKKAAQEKENRSQAALAEYKQFTNNINRHNIYVNSSTRANYANNLKLTDFGMHQLVSGSQASFGYPKNIFNEYGIYSDSTYFYGSDGSYMVVSTFENSGKKGMGYWHDAHAQNLYDVTDVILTESRAIFWGYTDSARSEILYEILYMDSSYSTSLLYYYPTPVRGSDDEKHKNYVIDCVYRMFEKSGTSYLPRSYDQFIHDEAGTKK